ncbi:hypothetical protein DIURU_002214 [Diutina rugosa]|uniref:Ketopantoate reductase C-terminal domain-containing protein n=1 Tax=Diutina rugosa TaxID=5481 RepID=A0A642UR60_DIURU|nr:uncharacterized protein DIURU_002214 [Diutina rugosa]KAA8903703.1 hypothetical protein DIURU_002214 [Diutina rugosa]
MHPSMAVSVCHPHLHQGPISVHSNVAGTDKFAPQAVYSDLAQVPRGAQFDVVVLAASSLQDFQGKCEQLAPLVKDDSLVIIESTGYINLEPFVQLSLPKTKRVTVLSIMNEADVRNVGPNEYTHTHRNSDPRVYLGSTQQQPRAAQIKESAPFLSVCRVFSETPKTAFLTSFQPKEFMTYQWKLALPRIVFNPLSVIFEVPFPSELSQQILCKPLISGIINELFKIIKKMECKLVKGFENEANLLKSWSAAFPVTKDNADFRNSPNLFYNFYHQQQLELDLLLLQPILLADDHGIKSPYLENMYSTLCQYDKINDGESILFDRKGLGGQSNHAKSAGHAQLDGDIASRQDELAQLERQLQEKRQTHQRMSHEVSGLSRKLTELESAVARKTAEASSSSSPPQAPADDLRGLAIHDDPDKSSHLLEKEMELQRREQELINREQMFAASSPSQSSPSQMAPGQFDPYRPQMMSSPPSKQNLFADGYGRNGPPPMNGGGVQGPPQLFDPNRGMVRSPSGNLIQQAPPGARRVPSLPQMNVGGLGDPNMFQARVPASQIGESTNHPSFNNAAPIDPLLESRFKQNPKKTNRRSAHPQMTGNLDGFDVGGRGGMPMPGKYRASVGPGGPGQFNRPQQYGHMSVTNNPNVTNIMAGRPSPQLASPPQQQTPQFQPPSAPHHDVRNDSNGSLPSSASYGSPVSELGDAPAPPPAPVEDSAPNHSFSDVDARPLGSGLGAGADEPDKKKKKKKGFFGKKKK